MVYYVPKLIFNILLHISKSSGVIVFKDLTLSSLLIDGEKLF